MLWIPSTGIVGVASQWCVNVVLMYLSLDIFSLVAPPITIILVTGIYSLHTNISNIFDLTAVEKFYRFSTLQFFIYLSPFIVYSSYILNPFTSSEELSGHLYVPFLYQPIHERLNINSLSSESKINM